MRIRTVKPEFWSHPVMQKQSDATKLLALGLLNMADDEGYFYADPKAVRNSIRQNDDDSGITTVSLRDLSGIGFIEMREHETHGMIGFIPSFAVHQVINKPKPSKIKHLFEYGIDTVSIPYSSHTERKGKEGNKERKRTGKKEQAPFVFDLPFDSDDFKHFWESWISYRQEIKKPIIETTAKMQLAKLKAMGESKAIATIRNSIGNGWAGLFEPKDQPTGSFGVKKPTTHVSHNDGLNDHISLDQLPIFDATKQ